MPDNIPDIVFKIDSNEDKKESMDEKIDFMVRIEDSIDELVTFMTENKDSIDRNAFDAFAAQAAVILEGDVSSEAVKTLQELYAKLSVEVEAKPVKTVKRRKTTRRVTAEPTKVKASEGGDEITVKKITLNGLDEFKSTISALERKKIVEYLNFRLETAKEAEKAMKMLAKECGEGMNREKPNLPAFKDVVKREVRATRKFVMEAKLNLRNNPNYLAKLIERGVGKMSAKEYAEISIITPAISESKLLTPSKTGDRTLKMAGIVETQTEKDLKGIFGNNRPFGENPFK